VSRLTKLSRSYPNHHVLLVGFEVALRTCFPTQKPSGCEGEERHEGGDQEGVGTGGKESGLRWRTQPLNTLFARRAPTNQLHALR